jgi:hypothetical protein
MVAAVTTAGGALEAGISYRTAAFADGTVERIAQEVRQALTGLGMAAEVGTVE